MSCFLYGEEGRVGGLVDVLLYMSLVLSMFIAITSTDSRILASIFFTSSTRFCPGCAKAGKCNGSAVRDYAPIIGALMKLTGRSERRVRAFIFNNSCARGRGKLSPCSRGGRRVFNIPAVPNSTGGFP